MGDRKSESPREIGIKAVTKPGKLSILDIAGIVHSNLMDYNTEVEEIIKTLDQIHNQKDLATVFRQSQKARDQISVLQNHILQLAHSLNDQEPTQTPKSR